MQIETAISWDPRLQYKITVFHIDKLDFKIFSSGSLIHKMAWQVWFWNNNKIRKEKEIKKSPQWEEKKV